MVNGRFGGYTPKNAFFIQLPHIFDAVFLKLIMEKYIGDHISFHLFNMTWILKRFFLSLLSTLKRDSYLWHHFHKALRKDLETN